MSNSPKTISFFMHENWIYVSQSIGVRLNCKAPKLMRAEKSATTNTHTNAFLDLDRSLLISNCNFFKRPDVRGFFPDEFYWLCVRNKFTTAIFCQIALFFILPKCNSLLLSCLIRSHDRHSDMRDYVASFANGRNETKAINLFLLYQKR